ncbi:MAG: GxxExxY protein [Chromatiales bacterium]|nr:GxxExxY protein [Chromatiales bacterium]
MEDHDLADYLIDAAARIRATLGQGRAPAVYRDRLMLALRLEGIRFEREYPYGGIDDGVVYHVYRQRPAISDRILLMICDEGECPDEYGQQLLTLLRLSDVHLGVVMDFTGPDAEISAKRVVNHTWPTIRHEQRRRPAA